MSKQNLPKIVIKKPIIINFKNDPNIMKAFVMTNLINKNQYKEEIIYQGEFVDGESQKIVLSNYKNNITKACHTVAKYYKQNSLREKTSHNVAKLIGQKNYETVLTCLCSVNDQDLKVKAILALLTGKIGNSDKSCQTETYYVKNKIYQEKQTQTEKTYHSKDQPRPIVAKKRMPRRGKRVYTYAVPDIKHLQKPAEELKYNTRNLEIENRLLKENEILLNKDQEYEDTETANELPDLKSLVDNAFSDTESRITHLSLDSIPGLKHTEQLLEEIQKRSGLREKGPVLSFKDGVQIEMPVKPDTIFHFATRDVLRSIPQNLRIRLIMLQADIDWENCLNRDGEGNFPIHFAVLTNDLELLKRQCLALRKKSESVDLYNDDNLTPLELAIINHASPSCTQLLLQNGADVFHTNKDYRTPIHIAAQKAHEHLEVIIDYCKANARKILRDHEDLWKPRFDSETDEQLTRKLLDVISTRSDSIGYTPLMAASAAGAYKNVELLLQSAPRAVDRPMSSSGDTALFLAVRAACMDAVGGFCARERGDASAVSDNFLYTIETLRKYGADPLKTNDSSDNVQTLLSQFNKGNISYCINAKLSSVKQFSDSIHEPEKNFESVMLVNENGHINVKDIKIEKVEQDYCETFDNPLPSTSYSSLKEELIVKNEPLERKNVTNFKINPLGMISDKSIVKNPLTEPSDNFIVKKRRSAALPFILKCPLDINVKGHSFVAKKTKYIVKNDHLLGQSDKNIVESAELSRNKDKLNIKSDQPSVSSRQIIIKSPTNKINIAGKINAQLPNPLNSNRNIKNTGDKPMILQNIPVKLTPVTCQNEFLKSINKNATEVDAGVSSISSNAGNKGKRKGTARVSSDSKKSRVN